MLDRKILRVDRVSGSGFVLFCEIRLLSFCPSVVTKNDQIVVDFKSKLLNFSKGILWIREQAFKSCESNLTRSVDWI